MPDVGDIQNSPAVEVLERLSQDSEITIVDLHVDGKWLPLEHVRWSSELDISGPTR